MALPAVIKTLLQQLINEFPGTSNPSTKDRLWQRTSSILKQHHQTQAYSAIQGRFDGLEERCRVSRNDELADALVHCYEKLDIWQNHAKSDVLSFLLELADNPIEKTRLEQLEQLVPTPIPPSLTWKDLIRDDPYDDESIWQDINYAESSSEGSVWSVEKSDEDEKHLQDLQSSSVIDYVSVPLSSARRDVEQFEAIVRARKEYLTNESTKTLTETQAIKEILFMLHGLPNSLFSEQDGILLLKQPIAIRGVSAKVVQQILETFCLMGNDLALVQNVIQSTEDDTLFQCFSSCFESLLLQFHTKVSQLEQSIINSNGKATTLLSVMSILQSSFQPIAAFQSLLQAKTSSLDSVELLEALYEVVVQQQSLGSTDLYMATSDVFFTCLNKYLWAIEVWIESGDLERSPKNFFIQRHRNEAVVVTSWQDSFQLKLDQQGLVQSPGFLRTVARKAFILGQGIHLMRRIDPIFDLALEDRALARNFNDVCGKNNSGLTPFADNLDAALEYWIKSKSNVSERQVIDTVIHKSKIRQILSAVQFIFFSKDGVLSQRIAYNIFELMDGRKVWKDRYLLTDIYQEHLMIVPDIDTERISIDIQKRLDRESQGRSVRVLGVIQLDYRLDWPTTILIQFKHRKIFSSIAVLLLQLKRASYLLDHLPTLSPPSQARQSRQGLILLLTQRLRWFLNIFLSYITMCVLEQSSNELSEHLLQARDLDELVAKVDATITALPFCCMLAEEQGTTHNAIVSMLDLVVLFSDLCSSIVIHPQPRTKKDPVPKGDDSTDEEKILGPQDPNDGDNAEAAIKDHFQKFENLLSFIVAGVQETNRSSKHAPIQILLDMLVSQSNRR